MTPTEKANQIIAFLSELETSNEEKLEVIANVRKRIEAMKQEEELSTNKFKNHEK